MSHFTVTVRIPAVFEQEEIPDVLKEALKPYNEQGDSDDIFMVFKDETENYRSEYEDESQGNEMFELDGEFYYPWNDELKRRFIKPSNDPFHKDPQEEVKLEAAVLAAGGKKRFVPYKEKYKTFKEFAEGYHGSRLYQVDGETRYGYYHNPNAKWDWWVIGGRWSGFWPVKNPEHIRLGESGAFNNKPEAGKTDIVRIKDIDFDSAAEETRQRVEKFLSEYHTMYETGIDPEDRNPFAGPRSYALKVGLIQCLDENEITDEIRNTKKLIKWDHQLIEGVDRYDVLSPIPTDPKEAADFYGFLVGYFNDLRTFSYLDVEKKEWVEAGEMGWWGMDSSDTESRKQYVDKFTKWLLSGNQEDWIVVVDCHI